jgi:signal peptidase I
VSARSSIDRLVRREAKLLVREVRRGLARGADRIDAEAAGALARGADALEAARRAGDGAAMRIALVDLGERAEEQLPFARKSTVREYVESIGIAILIALFLRAFVIEAFKIPSGSMIPSLEIGDHIFVNKFLYGVRIPYTDRKVLEVRAPRRGEVIVFVYPCDRERDYIKRIVAVAGDTVEVRCNLLYVNGEPVPQTLMGDRDCRFWDYNERYGQADASWDTRFCPLATPESPWALCNCSRYREALGGLRYETIYRPQRPAEGDLYAGSDFPRVPRPGPVAQPQCDTDEWRAAQLGEFVDTARGVGRCQLQRHYVVPAGHVFVMGDNREKSNDSRVWGPVPLDDIKGKALFVWWAGKPDPAERRQWERIGALVH